MGQKSVDVLMRKLEESAITTFEHVRDKTFENEVIELDGKKFSNCSFDGCVVEYSGGDTEIGMRCSTTGVRPRFKGAAARAVRLLHALGLLAYDPFEEEKKSRSSQGSVAADR